MEPVGPHEIVMSVHSIFCSKALRTTNLRLFQEANYERIFHATINLMFFCAAKTAWVIQI